MFSKVNYFKVLLSLLIFFGILIILFCYVSTVKNISDIHYLDSAKSGYFIKFFNNSLKLSELTDLDPYQLRLINSNISYQGYLDTNFSKDCAKPNRHDQLFDLLKFWIDFTEYHNIIWWLSYGSLIGSIRHKDMVPWDSDVDIAVPTEYESVIRNFSTNRVNITNKQVNIVTRPGAHCPYNGLRADCKGNIVSSHVDGCAFCGPLARIFYDPWKRIDIYLFELKKNRTSLEVFDEGMFEYTDVPPKSPFNWYFPLKKCPFMGLTVRCPRKTETVLKGIYKTFNSSYQCVNGTWKKT